MDQKSMDQKGTRTFYEELVARGEYEARAGNTDPEPVSRFFGEIQVSGKTVFDFGCGSGSIPSLVQKAFGNWSSYVGIDSCPSVADCFNARKIPNARAEVCSVTAVGAYGDAEADIVVCLFLLQDLTLADGLKALDEIRRIARPGADALFGLTVNISRSEEEKVYRDRWTYIWNKTAFLNALADHEFGTIWEEERPGPTSDYRRVYIRAMKAARGSSR